MNEEKKKRYLVFGVILLSIAIISLSGTYAYFVASVGGTGNTTNNHTSVTAVDLGSIYYDGITTFTGTDLYPGQKFVQEFKIGPNSDSGTGVYKINLESVLPSAFGSDVTIKLYKTTDKVNNNVVRTEGTLVQSNEQYYQEDTITVNGTPELVFGSKALTNSIETVLETVEFDVATLSDTTYYLVYEYKNNGNQDAQQGLTFSGKVTVSLSKKEEEEEIVLGDPDVKYAVSVYGIEEDTYSLDNGATTQTAGLTFGPATGASFVSDYVSRDHNGAEHSGTTALGNPYRCIHDDDWETIIYWNDTDPYVYQKCQGDADHLSCTKTVPLYLNSTIKSTKYPDPSGDGVGMIYHSIKKDYSRWNRSDSTYSDLSWDESDYGTNRGGWPDSAVRNTLNGVVTDNMLNITNKDNGFAEAKLDESTALISAFPNELKNAIVPKAVRSDAVYNDVSGNNVTTYDKLWLFSAKEMYADSGSNNIAIRANEGRMYSRQAALGITTSSYDKNKGYSESGEMMSKWLRSTSPIVNYVVCIANTKGQVQMRVNFEYPYLPNGLAPGFSLR